jgi:hypothetical protein
MRPDQMHRMAHAGCHTLAPKAYRDVPRLTGDIDMDASILHGKNKDMPLRLALYCKGSAGGGLAYKPVTAYNGYSNYHGDD